MVKDRGQCQSGSEKTISLTRGYQQLPSITNGKGKSVERGRAKSKFLGEVRQRGRKKGDRHPPGKKASYLNGGGGGGVVTKR